MANDFSDVIAQKISVVQSKIQEQNKLILNPQYQVEKATAFLQSQVGDLNPEDEPAEVIQALLSVINRVPRFVGDSFSNDLTSIGILKQELNVWAVVAKEWQDYATLQKLRKEKAEELKEDIIAKNVEERTQRTRRKPGDHPGPSTRDLRKAKAQLREPGS